MVSKKPVIAIFVVIILVVVVVAYVFMGDDGDDGNNQAKLNSEHTVLYDQGENGFPKIDGGFIYWTDLDDDSVIQYEIATNEMVEHTLLEDENYSLSEIYPSDDFIICKYTYGELFNFTTEYLLIDLRDNSIEQLYIDAWGISFDYPYVVYHTLGLEEQNLFLYDIVTNSTELIEHTSWGKISGDHVVYSFGLEVHIYKISTKTDTVIMDSDRTDLDIEISNNNCLILDTEDTGPGAKTDIYTYNIISKDLKKVGTINDWVIHQGFDGRYLFWADGGNNEDVKAMDTNTEAKGTIASGQWIAPLAYGTFSADGNIVVWTSNYDIHMGRIVD
jgi:hypothetical protein